LLRAIPVGMQHMDGHLARYCTRCRGKTPAFYRDRGQREVLLALAQLIPQIPPMISAMG
jgi:hypothetical protein